MRKAGSAEGQREGGDKRGLLRRWRKRWGDEVHRTRVTLPLVNVSSLHVLHMLLPLLHGIHLFSSCVSKASTPSMALLFQCIFCGTLFQCTW
jgi:hypothetical protein